MNHYARATCYICDREVTVGVPRHGDGSVFVYHRHKNLDGDRCPSSRTVVDDRDVTTNGSYSYGHDGK